MIAGDLQGYRGKRVLMLQGPLGPFFARVAADLDQVGAEVYKVNFNGGDWLFSLRCPWRGVSNFTGCISEWPGFFSELLTRLSIDVVFLFGDCRPIHVPALAIARNRLVEVGVFEEGYLRPDYITLERGGVNNRSSLPDDPSFYLSQRLDPVPETHPMGSTFRSAALWGILYYTAATFGKPIFRSYQHHRRLGMLEGLYWMRSFVRKLRYRHRERRLDGRLLGEASERFFLVPLQTFGDAQIKVHSRFRSIPRFIEHVIRSFARRAPSDCTLVIKHHPLDRGYTNHTKLIERLIRKYQLESRCHYIHDQHLPSLLRNAQGVVVVNSTVGMSAVGEGVPVKVCGEAIYDMTGLTFQDELDSFWEKASAFQPDTKLWNAFRSFLIAHTQFNGSFYRKLPSTGYRSGVAWGVSWNEAEIPTTIPLPEWTATPLDAGAVLAASADVPLAATDRLPRKDPKPVEELAAAG